MAPSCHKVHLAEQRLIFSQQTTKRMCCLWTLDRNKRVIVIARDKFKIFPFKLRIDKLCKVDHIFIFASSIDYNVEQIIFHFGEDTVVNNSPTVGHKQRQRCITRLQGLCVTYGNAFDKLGSIFASNFNLAHM